jgi:uncharacterized protein
MHRHGISGLGESHLIPMDCRAEPDVSALRHAYDSLETYPERAVSELEALADRGSIMSMWYLGEAYYSGRYFSKNLDIAKQWFRKADDTGWAFGSHMLGRLCYITNDYGEALLAFTRGTERGYAPSMYRLGMMYGDGAGVTRDLAKCRSLLLRAIASRHLFAKRDLGTMYMRGAFGAAAIPKGILMLLSMAWELLLITVRTGNSISEFDDRVIA